MKFGNITADMYKRILDLKETLKHKSIFLFGPRQTGKSTLVHEVLPDFVEKRGGAKLTAVWRS